MIHETETKGELSSEEVQRQRRLERESRVLSHRRTLEIPEEWAELLGDATYAIGKRSNYVPASKKDQQSVLIYASTSKPRPARKTVTYKMDTYKNWTPQASFRKHKRQEN